MRFIIPLVCIGLTLLSCNKDKLEKSSKDNIVYEDSSRFFAITFPCNEFVEETLDTMEMGNIMKSIAYKDGRATYGATSIEFPVLVDTNVLKGYSAFTISSVAGSCEAYEAGSTDINGVPAYRADMAGCAEDKHASVIYFVAHKNIVLTLTADYLPDQGFDPSFFESLKIKADK